MHSFWKAALLNRQLSINDVGSLPSNPNKGCTGFFSIEHAVELCIITLRRKMEQHEVTTTNTETPTLHTPI